MVPKSQTSKADGLEAAVEKEACIRGVPRNRVLPAAVAGCLGRSEAWDVLLLEALETEAKDKLTVAALAVARASASSVA